MAKTNAERQAAWRLRRTDRTQRLETEINDLKQKLEQALYENEVLRAQLDLVTKPAPKPSKRSSRRFLYPSLRRQRQAP
jgi:hypothetical protein